MKAGGNAGASGATAAAEHNSIQRRKPAPLDTAPKNYRQACSSLKKLGVESAGQRLNKALFTHQRFIQAKLGTHPRKQTGKTNQDVKLH